MDATQHIFLRLMIKNQIEDEKYNLYDRFFLFSRKI